MINGSSYRNALISGANNITAHKSEINALNIFPVPDGDTGTNMSMTIEAAAKALQDVTSQSISENASAAASAMLKGARGNSGVILSLLFRGISNGLKDREEVDGKALVSAFHVGVEMAYKAVMNPTEGTILTVARMAFDAGRAAAEVESDPVIVFSALCSAAHDALEKTPEMLPVLKKAGVVDAGGKGLCLILDGMLSLFRDGVIISPAAAEDEPGTGVQAQIEASDEFFRNAAAEFDTDIRFTYCTEFIIGKAEELSKSPLELKSFLETIGDCVVVAEDEDIIKVHVHTENPGQALEEAITYGQLLTVKVENMKEQHRKAAEKYEKEKAAAEAAQKKQEELKPVEPENEVGFVAVASGEGLEALFRDLGCDHIVSGGQSMNPSTEDIYQAVMATPAKTVFVLPNNKNIILAAEQVIPLVEDRNVVIIPTKTIPQGIVAMLSYAADSTPELNRDYMTTALSNVSTGQVTYAARNSEFGLTRIKEGEIIGLNNGKLTIKEKDPVKAVVKLAKEMISRDTSYISVIYGNGITEVQANSAVDAIKAKAGNIEISLIDGGQPIYYFILSVE
ncbi:MAG: DAK2 domain-containing protein [Clostridia bacterium]|nr:DAK2 domain-containing protein [Clostridia bacterium]